LADKLRPSYGRLARAIVVAALVVAGGFVASSQLGASRTVTETTATTSLKTTTLVQTTTLTPQVSTQIQTTTTTQTLLTTSTLTQVSTETRSTTTTQTIVETTVSTFSLNSGDIPTVNISGTIGSVYRPVHVIFTYYPCNPIIPFQPGPSCPTVINANVSQVTSRPIVGGYAFSARFSVLVPNNQSYIVAIELSPQNSTWYSDSYDSNWTAAYLPLYSNAPAISNYNIQCNSEASANQTFSSAPLYCYSHYANTY